SVSQWMADKARFDAMALEERWLEWKDREQHINRLANHPRAPFAPGPGRGADVMHSGDAGAFEPALEPGVERWHIDANECRRWPGNAVAQQTSAQRQQARQLGNHFGEAEQPQFVGRGQGLAAGGLHLRPGHALENRIRKAPAQGRDQAGSELITRWF